MNNWIFLAAFPVSALVLVLVARGPVSKVGAGQSPVGIAAIRGAKGERAAETLPRPIAGAPRMALALAQPPTRAAEAKSDPAASRLYDTVAELDRVFFDAYNSCDLKKMGQMWVEDLEFYHDKSGLEVSRESNLEVICKNLCSENQNWRTRRELIEGSLEVYPLNRYLPLITRWLGRIPGMHAEIDDLAQEVFVVMAREIPRFDRQREGSFRAWLRQVTVNKVRTRRKQLYRHPVAGLDQTDGFLDQLAQPNSELAHEWDLDHDRHVFQKLLAIVQPDFQPATWEAFRRFAIEGRRAADVATELRIKVDSVIQAKSRILKRLREEAGELLG